MSSDASRVPISLGSNVTPRSTCWFAVRLQSGGSAPEHCPLARYVQSAAVAPVIWTLLICKVPPPALRRWTAPEPIPLMTSIGPMSTGLPVSDSAGLAELTPLQVSVIGGAMMYCDEF